MNAKLNGLILVDKAQNMTSHDVVSELRKILNTKAIGHAGTLDPMATGLLVCLVGEATKLSQYVMAEDKCYRVGIKIGVKTDSGDITGKILEEKNISHLTEEVIFAAARKLTGVLSLPVPKYSAVKISGRKLYEYARSDEEVAIPSKDMVISDVRVNGFEDGDTLLADIYCGKGTYVRSWAEKLGEDLKVGATVKSLRRLSSGPFTVAEAKTLGALNEMQKLGENSLIPMSDSLKGWPALRLGGRDASLVGNGQIPNAIVAQLRVADLKAGLRLIDEKNELLALLVKDPKMGFKLARVFATTHSLTLKS